MRHLRCVAFSLLAVWPALAAAAEAPAKPAAGKTDDAFFETVNVTVVNVDVFVTDKSGQRVAGLKPEDFQILEDGRPVQVSNFYALSGGKPVAEPSAAPTASQPEAPAQVPEDQRLRLIIYVDNFNLRPFNRNRVFGNLREFLSKKLEPGDQVMLVTYDRELHIRRPFTSDPIVVAQDLFGLEKISAQGIHADSDRRDILQAIEDAKDVSIMGQVRAYCASLRNDMEFTVGALKQLVERLAGLPGRKAVLYVSDGLPMRAGEDVFYALNDKFGQQISVLAAQEYDLSRRFQELTAEANANRVTFYTLEATGLRVGTDAQTQDVQPGRAAYLSSVHTSNLQAPLQLMAEATGGQAILNANNPGPQLARVAADFGTYYSLGYTPSHAGDGRYHRIEVKLKGKGMTIRHRDGYRDKSVESRMDDSTLAALLWGFEQNPLQAVIEFGRGKAQEDGLFLVPVRIKIPLGKIALVLQEGSYRARARVYVVAMDPDGDMSDVQQAQVPISIPEAEVQTAKQKSFTYEITLLMRPGNQRVAIGIRDEFGATSSFVQGALEVASP